MSKQSHNDSSHHDKSHQDHSHHEKVRLDKWLWAARFYKTRAIAKAMIEGGKVHYDGQRATPVDNDLRPACRKPGILPGL